MSDANILQIEDLRGGWNTSDPAIIADNEFAKVENWYYDDQQILTTRQGIANFGNPIAGAESIHSMYYIEFSDGSKHLLCAANMAATTQVYEYNPTTNDWDLIKAGLTKDLRLCFITFKNVIYWTNGTDNVMHYDGTTVTEDAVTEKGKYLVLFNDVAFMGCIINDKSVVYYTNANPVDLTGSFGNYIVIEEDNGQDISALQYQAGLLLVSKEKSIYSYDVVGDKVDILDYSGGVASHRSWKIVENDSLYLSKRGVYGLIQRKGTVGSLRALALTNNLQKVIKGIGNFGIACAFYSEKKSNYYLAIDQDAGGRNKGLLVRNTVVGAFKPTAGWTNYVGINVNDIIEYEDTDGATHILGANVFDGQVIEFEIGWDDMGSEIHSELEFKEFDFGEPTKHKTFPHVDFQGLASSNVTAKFKTEIDGREISKTFTAANYINVPEGVRPLGTDELGIYPLGGGPLEEEMPTENFEVRVNTGYDSGRRIQPKIECDIFNGKLQLKKIAPAVIVHPVDVFPTNNII
jgi:hypothetical protein